MAIQGLHNFQLGDRSLVVQRSEVSNYVPEQNPMIALPGTSTYLSQAGGFLSGFESDRSAEHLERGKSDWRGANAGFTSAQRRVA